MSNNKQYQKLIHSVQWLKLRKEALTQHPVCQDCEAEGIIRPASEVHHVTPVEYGRTFADMKRLMYDAHNLRCLCHGCHVKAHIALGRSGKVATQRRNREQVGSFIKRAFGDDPGGDF